MKQLILQVLGAGGDNHLAAGQQRRHQVGHRLAGAGAGLQHRHAFGFDRLLDRLRHLDLLRSMPKAGNGRSDWA